MRDQDQQFFDSFMLVVGILIGVAVFLFFQVRMIAIETQGRFTLEDPTVQAAINGRIAPVGKVVLLGSDELAAAAAPPVAIPARMDVVLTGEQVYGQICNTCHAPPGLVGAPALGDSEAWDPRIAKGMEALTDSALHGIGAMPPKGGGVGLSDGEILSAVDYMLEQVGE